MVVLPDINADWQIICKYVSVQPALKDQPGAKVNAVALKIFQYFQEVNRRSEGVDIATFLKLPSTQQMIDPNFKPSASRNCNWWEKSVQRSFR